MIILYCKDLKRSSVLMDKKEIEDLCKNLMGKTLNDVLPKDELKNHKKNNKGKIGQYVEKYFGIKTNSDSTPDFKEIGIELKVTPLKVSKKKSSDSITCYVPKERVKLTTINYYNIINEFRFDLSHIYEKCKQMLFIFYIYNEKQDFINYKFNSFSFYNLDSDINFKQISKDYDTIKEKVLSGLAHQLSESDTELLGACTCSSDGNVRVQQPNSEELAKPRSFSFKLKQMNNILNNINIPNIKLFENDIKKNIVPYTGKTINELCKYFQIDKITKNIKSVILCKILGVDNYLEYINKFNINKIMLKNISIKENGKLKEEIGLIDVNFYEFNEVDNFYDSEFCMFIDKLNIFFILWKKNGKDEILDSLKVMSINDEHLLYAKLVWEHTRNLFLKSVCIQKIIDNKYYYNFIKSSDDKLFHVRPHDQKRINRYKMPNGEDLCKFQYWLNKDFFKK